MGGGERCRWTPLGMRQPGYEPWLCHASPDLGPPLSPDSSLAPQFQSCCREKEGNSTAGSLMHGLNHLFIISLLNYSSLIHNYSLMFIFSNVYLYSYSKSHTFIHSFIYSLTSSIYLLIHSFIHLFTYLFLHLLLISSLIRSPFHSFSPLCTHCLFHAVTPSAPHSPPTLIPPYFPAQLPSRKRSLRHGWVH